jgi:hypothetical protein
VRRPASAPPSLAWLGVALVGLIVIAIVVGLRLVPRLGAGQKLIDAAGPALTDERVAGTRAGVEFVSRYVDVADPLLTARGGGARERAQLIGLLAARTPLTQREAAAVLRRAAPRIDALLRALPLSAAARETPRLTRLLAVRLGVTEDEVAATLEASFPRLAQMLTALRSVTSGWNDMPGSEGLTRFDGTTQVRTVPQMRDLLDADLTAALERNRQDFGSVAGSGGVGFLGWLLLAVGVLALGWGLLQVLRAQSAPPGGLAWSVIAGTGVLLVVAVVALQLFARLNAADDVLDDLQPAFEDRRVQGIRAGADMLHQAVLFGDPIATRRDGGSADARRFVAFVSRRTNLPPAQVRSELRRRAPKTAALLQAIPLSTTSAQAPRLLAELARRMKLSRRQVVLALRRRTPRLAQTILGLQPLAAGWRAIPGTAALTRFDGTPVRRMPAFDAYLSEDVVPVLERRRQSFRDFRDPWPPLGLLAPLVLALGIALALYGLLAMSALRG